ncbi:MAG: mechanosensitive ion channel family protein [Treponema sp.]|nr:mechanosensitive ion channel family protein [Treponema sp.]
MKKFFILLTVVLLLFPSSFLAAQEADVPQAGNEEAASEIAVVEEKIEEAAADIITSATIVDREPEESLNFFQRLAIAIAIVAGQVLLIWFIWYLFKRLDIKLEHSTKHKIKPFVIKKFTVLGAKQVVKIIEFFLRLLKYFITAVLLFLTLPVVFSLFPATRSLASALFQHVFNPVKDIAVNAVMYIPNLFKIAVIVIITRYVLKALKYFADKIEKGKLVIPRFYTDWAAPTYKILQVLLWAFTVALVYPYLPGSDSRAFQGVSVFIGIIFSIGSTSAIGNLVAGLVITYMRPFKIGDRVKINDTVGFVVEKNLMVIRIKTHKNEYVTFPNLMILNSNIVNYNTSSDEDEEGLIIYAEVTFGYSTPWQTVHDILINAALATEHVQKKPKPFVLQTKMDDFYACYQINCYTKDVSRVPAIYTLLYENIQNGFREAGLDMTSAHYRVITSGNKQLL